MKPLKEKIKEFLDQRQNVLWENHEREFATNKLAEMFEKELSRAKLQSPKPKNLDELREKFEYYCEEQFFPYPLSVHYGDSRVGIFNFFLPHLSTLDTERGVSDEEIEKEAQETKSGVPRPTDRIIGFEDGAKWMRDKLSPHTGESEWISVDDRLPEIRLVVQLNTEFNGHTKGFYEGGVWRYQNNSARIPMNITHWMPLPQPPKEFKSQNP